MTWKKNRAAKREWMQERKAEKADLEKGQQDLKRERERFEKESSVERTGAFLRVDDAERLRRRRGDPGRHTVVEWQGAMPTAPRHRAFAPLPDISQFMGMDILKAAAVVEFDVIWVACFVDGVEYRWRTLRPVIT